MSAIEHYQKYEKLAQKLGVTALEALAEKAINPHNRQKNTIKYLKDCYSHDRYLNNIPLSQWDILDFPVKTLVQHSGGGFHSLCQTVCVLKHVAVYHMLKIKPPTK
jgi:hypothetical protein